ncbi:MAG: outer membrane protein transport protein [Proteobacteria bacterium]|nr:outer membrane protein transport protein [Pseudomonadota bacterium]
MRLLLCSFLFSLWLAPAQAAIGNYNSILIGDQAAGMGGAYTALTSDASALAWYNPATLAFLQGQSFSAAVGIYKKFDIRYAQDESLEKASLRVNQGFFRALPSSTGSVVRYEDFLKDYTLGLSIVTPNYESFKGRIKSSADFVSSFEMVDESIWVGVGIGRKISMNEGFGLTLYYTARSLSKSVTDITNISSTDKKIYTEQKDYFQNGVVPILGYYHQYSTRFRWGFSVRLPVIPVAGEGAFSSSLIDTTTNSQPTANFDDVKSRLKIPMKETVGIAWIPQEKWILSFDVSHYHGLKYLDIEEPTVAETIQHNELWNVALGGQYLWNDQLKFRGGLFTNLSAHPNPDPALVRGQGDRVDQLGFSANAALLSGKIEYTFGGYYTGGKGRSVQRVNQNYEVVTKSVQIFTMLVGTSYSF